MTRLLPVAGLGLAVLILGGCVAPDGRPAAVAAGPCAGVNDPVVQRVCRQGGFDAPRIAPAARR